MNDPDARQDDLPEARSVRTRWPGLVWAIPLAALMVVAYLGVRALTRHGIGVVVTFGYAEGVTPGDTKVLVNGVEAGHVSKVRVSQDGHHVDVTLSLDPREKSALNSATEFWLIGENPTITDIQSIRAAVAGVIIAMAPGKGGTPTRHFAGLDSPPLISPGTRGTSYLLEAPTLGSIEAGAAVSYHGLQIGKVITTRMMALNRFRLGIFMSYPFDRLVRPGALFWAGSPLKLSLSGGSLSAGLASPSSVLQGAVQFELPDAARSNPQAAADTVFPLFNDEQEAEQGPVGPQVPYRIVLTGAAGDLQVGSNVTMQGYTVGAVRSARLAFAPGSRPLTEAVIMLYPQRLDVALPATMTASELRAASDRAVQRLLALGYVAHLTQSPPFVGAHVITLAAAKGARPAHLGTAGTYPTIPAAHDGGSADDLIARADQILETVSAMPLEQIGENVRRATGNLAAISGSPQVRDSITHLDLTLQQLDRITAQVQPQVGPLLTKLNQTAEELQGTAAAARTVLSGEGATQDRSLPDAIQQLDEAARSIRTLTDYLGRHPEALVRGKKREK